MPSLRFGFRSFPTHVSNSDKSIPDIKRMPLRHFVSVKLRPHDDTSSGDGEGVEAMSWWNRPCEDTFMEECQIIY